MITAARFGGAGNNEAFTVQARERRVGGEFQFEDNYTFDIGGGRSGYLSLTPDVDDGGMPYVNIDFGILGRAAVSPQSGYVALSRGAAAMKDFLSKRRNDGRVVRYERPRRETADQRDRRNNLLEANRINLHYDLLSDSEWGVVRNGGIRGFSPDDWRPER
jgi:hypothetical protein